MIIRRGLPADEAALIELSQTVHRESRFAYLRFDPAQAKAMVQLCIAGGPFVAIVAEGDGGALAGCVLAYAICAPLSDERIAGEFIFYVAPERRGGRAAAGLWKAVLEWCREVGAREAIMNAPDGERFDEVTKLYRHMGFERQGELWVKRI